MLTTKNSINMADKKVMADDMVTVQATGSGSHFKSGKKVMHRIAAEKLVEKGVVTIEGDAVKKKGKGKGKKVANGAESIEE